MKLDSCTGFSVDFSKSVETKSYFSHFSVKKLPLEALEDPVLPGMQSGSFCQNGRLGPPESDGLLRSGCRKSVIPRIPAQKQ